MHCKFQIDLIMKEEYGTLSQTINVLKENGYTFDFNIHQNCIICNGSEEKLSPNEFKIDKVYRFEGETDPSDQSILYAISSTKYNVKGVLVNGYGISTNADVDDLISKLNTHPE